MKERNYPILFKLLLSATTCFISFSSSAVTSSESLSSITKLYPSTSGVTVLPRTSLARTVESESKTGQIVTDFSRLYHQLDTSNETITKTTTPRPADEQVKQAFSSTSDPIKLSSKQKIETRLTIKMDALGTPAFIGGINDHTLLRSNRAKAGLLPDESAIQKQARGFFDKYATTLKLKSPADELQFSKLFHDDAGQTHARYSQSYKDIPVWKSELVVHMNKQGDVISMDGKYIPSPNNIAVKPDINAEQAIAAAKAIFSGSASFANADSKLVIYADKNQHQPVLAWQIKLDISLTKQLLVLVDAKTSEILLSYNTVATENVQGQGQDSSGASRPLNVWQTGGEFFLHDTSKPMFDASTDPLDLDTSKGVIHIVDARNQPPTDDLAGQPLPDLFHIKSNSPTSGWVADGVGAAFGFSETYDYYREKHGRDSLDGNGGNINAIVRLGQNFFNAFWSSDLNLMGFGDADNFSAALDVVGHELTHGVTSNASNLIYNRQSGALNEALSDIFGEAIEQRSQGQNDWLMGSALREPFRNMKDPGSIIISGLDRPYPSKMSEYIELTDEQDNGGVHINSSIINHAFYQLAEGLSNSIGIDQAAEIFYRANTVHLLPRSDFSDARRACIQSADEIFGANSTQTQVVAAAFDAVEIFDTPGQPTPPPSSPVDSEDSVVLIFEHSDGNIYAARRETALDDPEPGSFLSQTVAQRQRPAVSGDGSVAAFIKADFDLCLINTDGTNETCLGNPGVTHSIAFSPDGRFVSLILRNPATGEIQPSVIVLDLTDDSSIEYPLQAVAIDGTQANTLAYADAMDFTADSRFLIYDALNNITLTDGAEVSTWSIYALDLVSQSTVALIPPSPGLNVGNPSLSNINSALITFDAFDDNTNANTVLAANLATGEVVAVGQTDAFSVPSLNGDDSSIIYSLSDGNATGFSLYQQSLQADTLQPAGQASLWLRNGFAGVIYRRGSFTAPAGVDIKASQTTDKATFKANDEALTFSVTLKNNGPDTATNIVATNNFTQGLNIDQAALPTICNVDNTTKVTCTIDSLNAGDSGVILLKFQPAQTGDYSNAVDVVTNEQDNNDANNSAFAKVTVTTTGGGDGDGDGDGGDGGGGGGSLSWLLLLMLALSAQIRHKTGKRGCCLRLRLSYKQTG